MEHLEQIRLSPDEVKEALKEYLLEHVEESQIDQMLDGWLEVRPDGGAYLTCYPGKDKV